LELRKQLTDPYLVTFVAFAMILFVIAFYLPIMTSIKLGPISLEKVVQQVGLDPQELVPITENPLDANLDDWKIEQPSPSGVPRQESPPQPIRTPSSPEASSEKPQPKQRSDNS